MTDADIKKTIKTVEIRHEHGWWVADMPDIGVATQAKTLPELGVEIERIVIAHFEVCAEHDADPFRCRRLSSIDEVTATLNVVLKTRTATYAAMASALRGIERRLRETAADVGVNENDVQRIRALMTGAAAAVAAVAEIVETPLTTKVEGP